MMSSTLNLNTPAAANHYNREGAVHRLPSCPPAPRLSQEVGLIIMSQQQHQQNIPYFPQLASLPRTPKHQQRKRSYFDHTHSSHQQQQQYLQPRPESFDPIKHVMMPGNSARYGAAAASCVTPNNSTSDFSSADAEMMDTSSFDEGNDRCSSGGAAKETKRRRRATLADEYSSRGSPISCAVQKSRSSFPRAA